MKVEILVYIYLAVCVSMIIFNIVYAYAQKHMDRRMDIKSEKTDEKIKEQLNNVKEGIAVDDAHKEYLKRKLCRINSLLAFDRAMEMSYVEFPEETVKYLTEINGVFVHLMLKYRKKESIQTAYFPYVIRKYRILTTNGIHADMKTSLLSLLESDNLFCRENALQAIYSSADGELVLEALKILDKSKHFHHSRLISEGLVFYEGNSDELDRILCGNINKFKPFLKSTLLKYMRLRGGKNYELVLSILKNEKEDHEVRYECIRFFGRNYYEEARPVLLSLAKSDKKKRWEYSAIASTALATYPGDDTVEILKENLYDFNWHIRANSAESLDRLGLTYFDLIDVFESGDRFAREILRYRLDKRKMKEGKADVG